MSVIQVLETHIQHVSDIIYWLDGTSSQTTDSMHRVPHSLRCELSSAPGDLQLRQAPGKTALWRRSSASFVAGQAPEEERSFTPASSFALAGTVYDPQGIFNPQIFSIVAGGTVPPVAGHQITLFRTPLGTRFGKGGGITATLRAADDGAVTPWAMVLVTVTIPGRSPQIYRGQADQHGDVLLPFHRLPPLPEGLTHYMASLSVQASPAASATSPPEMSSLVAMELESLTSTGNFATALDFSVVPGEIRLIRSANKGHIAIRAV